jgi:hypothetical protein
MNDPTVGGTPTHVIFIELREAPSAIGASLGPSN